MSVTTNYVLNSVIQNMKKFDEQYPHIIDYLKDAKIFEHICTTNNITKVLLLGASFDKFNYCINDLFNNKNINFISIPFSGHLPSIGTKDAPNYQTLFMSSGCVNDDYIKNYFKNIMMDKLNYFDVCTKLNCATATVDIVASGEGSLSFYLMCILYIYYKHNCDKNASAKEIQNFVNNNKIVLFYLYTNIMPSDLIKRIQNVQNMINYFVTDNINFVFVETSFNVFDITNNDSHRCTPSYKYEDWKTIPELDDQYRIGCEFFKNLLQYRYNYDVDDINENFNKDRITQNINNILTEKQKDTELENMFDVVMRTNSQIIKMHISFFSKILKFLDATNLAMSSYVENRLHQETNTQHGRILNFQRDKVINDLDVYLHDGLYSSILTATIKSEQPDEPNDTYKYIYKKTPSNSKIYYFDYLKHVNDTRKAFDACLLILNFYLIKINSAINSFPNIEVTLNLRLPDVSIHGKLKYVILDKLIYTRLRELYNRLNSGKIFVSEYELDDNAANSIKQKLISDFNAIVVNVKKIDTYLLSLKGGHYAKYIKYKNKYNNLRMNRYK